MVGNNTTVRDDAVKRLADAIDCCVEKNAGDANMAEVICAMQMTLLTKYQIYQLLQMVNVVE